MSFLNLTLFELKKLAVAKSTWILLAIFVCLANISTFFLAGFLILNKASLQAFLKYAPIFITLFAFLISFSTNIKELKKANAIKLTSLPISLPKLVAAKFTANSILGVLFLALSSSFIISINYIGTPDHLLTFAGLLACLLFFKLCFAISSFTNAIAKSSFESLGYSILIMFILCLAGLGAVSTMLEIILPASLVAGLTKYSVINSYYNITSGFVGLNDLVLYGSLIIFFLSSAMLCANKNIYKSNTRKTIIAIMFLVTLILNTVTFNSTIKFDLTSDKIYSISDNLKNIVNKLDNRGVKITFFYSESNPSIPLDMQRIADYTDKYLTQLEKESEGKITYIKKDTELNASYEVQALKEKIAEIPLANGDSMFAGISVRKGADTTRIPYISIDRKSFLEYDIASNLVKFMADSKYKKIGILTDLDLGNANQSPAFLKELQKRYDIDIIPMTYPIFPKYDLVISFMTPFAEPATLYAADQYLVNGGKMLMFFDPFFRTAPEDDFLMPDRKADDSAFDHLADLLRHYGIDYDYNSILGDKTRSMTINSNGIGAINYPLWMLYSESEMNKEIPIFANLNNIVIPEGGFFTNKNLLPTLQYTPLLTSTANSQVVSRALFNTIGDPKGVASRLKGEQKKRDFAFMIKGNFLSAFTAMPNSVKKWFEGAQSLEGLAKTPKHIKVSENKGVLIAIADMDFMSDYFSTSGEKNIDGSITKKTVSDNQFFLTNTIDYMLADYDLISLRSKGDNLRTLKKIENLISDDIAKKEFQENALARDIELKAKQYESLTKRLNIIKEPEQFFQITKMINDKQEEIVKAKRKLKAYKRSLRETVENYARKVALINILFAPALLLIIGLLFFIRRYFKAKK